jgi:dimethylsulfide dehydrogenase subunit gamma/complex iron-sulfur molybdoenzyme family reductase subunit gamma
MKRACLLVSGLAAVGVLLAALVASRAALLPGVVPRADETGQMATPTTLPPAERLRIAVGDHRGSAAPVLADEPAVWAGVPPTRVLLNRTPRLFQTEPPTAAAPPILQVGGLRAEGNLYLRLEWPDATRDASRSRGTGTAFSDAAAVMVPHEWKGGPFPSLQMGDKQNPVHLYYWSAATGAEEMTATGRTTPAPTGKKVRHQTRHGDGKWVLVVEMPDPIEGWPVAFAVWDGHNQDRDGRKAFSLWHALMSAPAERKQR